MKKVNYEFQESVRYCGFDNLPEGLDQYYELYQIQSQENIIERVFLNKVFERFQVNSDSILQLMEAISAVEEDPILLHFSQFLIWDMCAARNRYDIANYKNMTPACMKVQKELYSFVLLLACVEPSMKQLRERGVPEQAYIEIPYQPMKSQLEKLAKGDKKVSDFPWDRNFYTCSIFLMDRFLFIPYRFGDSLSMYRNRETKKVMALKHAGEEFRRDGQVNGINQVFDKEGAFVSIWNETEEYITANSVNPMGFVIKEPITLSKIKWERVLWPGDTLLALHVPSGPGYNPQRLRNSMLLALDFYDRYFPELIIKGFWSESWLYDSRLSLILEEESSNIIKVQRQFYLYPIKEGDSMLRYEVFGGWKADPEKQELTSTLQKAAATYMRTGKQFNTMSMIVLREEADCTDRMPYITQEDIDVFYKIVDSHL